MSVNRDNFYFQTFPQEIIKKKNTHTLCFAKKSVQIIFNKYGLLKRKKAHIFLKLEKCYH